MVMVWMVVVDRVDSVLGVIVVSWFVVRLVFWLLVKMVV